MIDDQSALPVLIGEKVLWLGSGSGKPKSGRVSWIGKLPEISDDWTLGLELDESLPFGGIDGKWRGRQLFDCKPKHGLLVPASKVLSAKDGASALEDPNLANINDGNSALQARNENIKPLGHDSFCGSLYSHVKPKPAVRKKHQQLCIFKSDNNNNTHDEAVLKNHNSVTSNNTCPMPHGTLSERPIIPPRNKDVLKFCKLFDYSEPTNIIIDDRHYQLYNEIRKSNTVLNFSTQIEGDQNGVRIRKTMSAYYGNNGRDDVIEHNDAKKVSSLKTVKKRLFSKSNSSNVSSNLSTASSACSDSSVQEKRLSGLFSFFRWFNKDKRKNTLPYEDDDCFPSEPTTPRFRRAPTYSGSVDSVYSTATCNSFFYVPPSNYKSKRIGIRRIPLGTETDTYRNRVKEVERSKEIDKNISLKSKYKLLGSAVTLHSSADNVSLSERNFPSSCNPRTLSSPGATFRRRKREAPKPPESSSNPNIELLPSDNSNKPWKNHRRSSSESAKDKKAGAYFHVKGKRKAPPPPPLFASRNKTLPRDSSLGSLNRRKRQAPQPPKRNSAIFPSTSRNIDDIFENIVVKVDSSDRKEVIDQVEGKAFERIEKNSPEDWKFVSLKENSVDDESNLIVSEPGSKIINLLEDSDLENKTDSSRLKLDDSEVIQSEIQDKPKEDPIVVNAKDIACDALMSKAEKQKLFEDFEKLQAHNKKRFNCSDSSRGESSKMAHSVCNDSLKLEKGILKQNKSNCRVRDGQKEDRNVPPSSPVAPRPWYKRNIQNTCITQGTNKLHLLEKLKSLEKSKEEPKESNDFPEVSGARKIRQSSSDSSVFSFLSTGHSGQSVENKRRSQLSILTNISELDREAAEIVRKERMRNLQLVSAENEKFYDTKLELPMYSESEPPSIPSPSGSQKKTSARDLISLFNAISNVTKVTVNTAFFTKDTLNLFSKETGDKKAASHASKSAKKNSEKKKSSPVESSACVSPITERKQESCTFVNLHAFDELIPKPSESQNLCDEVMTEFDLRKSRTQELFEINRMRRHHSPSPSIPTITEMSESLSGSISASSRISPLATVTENLFPAPSFTSVPSAPVATVTEEVKEKKVDLSLSNSYNAVWSCPQCTLENPMWRILCDACHLFRTTISVKPLDPPMFKPVDLSLTVKTTNSPSSVSTTSITVVDSKKSTVDVASKSKQAVTVNTSVVNKPITTASGSNSVSENIAPKLVTSTESQLMITQDSPLVETPPINFAEAKMKFTNLGSKVTDVKTASPSSGNINSKIDVQRPLTSRSLQNGISTVQNLEEKKSTAGARETSIFDIIKENSETVSKSTNIPSSSSSILIDDTSINTNTREEKLIRDKIVLSINEEATEVRKARLAFFDKKAANISSENNLNKQMDKISEPRKLMNDKNEMDIAERDRLKLMLREMKHSLAKQESLEEKSVVENEPTPSVSSPVDAKKLGAIKKVKKVDLDSKKFRHKKVEDYLDGMEQEKIAEAYLVTSNAVFEDIKVKDDITSKPSFEKKVSTSVQTTSVIRRTDSPPNNFNKPPISKNTVVGSNSVVAPIIAEEYNIKSGKAHSSIKRDLKPISLNAFELIRARDFANSKTQNPQIDALEHTYSNILPDPCVSESYSQISEQSRLNGSNIFAKKTSSTDYSGSSNGTTSSNVSRSVPENVTTLAINRLLRRLETAIANGQHHQAAALAKDLARLKISCSVVRQKAGKADVKSSVTVNMFVEDKTSHQGPFPLDILPDMKVVDLKLKVEAEFEVPVRFQRWILGKQLATDDSRTLRQLGVDSPGCPFFLYLVAPESKKLESANSTAQSLDEKPVNESKEQIVTPSVPPLTFSSSDVEDNSFLDNTISGISNILEEVAEEDISEDLDNTDVSLTDNAEQLPESSSGVGKEDESAPIKNWECPSCTLINEPAKLICALCVSSKPEDLQVPDSSEDSGTVNQLSLVDENRIKEAAAEVKLSNYHELLNLDKADLIPNAEEFDCSVCLSVCKPGDGVVLRECLHTFCKVCLANMIGFCEEPEVKCPFQDLQYSCESTLQEREIKALVTVEQYESHLAKSIAQAETKIRNAFHCKTPDCRGWCIFEDNVNYFLCPVCNRNNCLTCQAIHTGINCKQYQEEMKEESETNVDAKRTRDMLDEMVERGEAMACPTCQVVLMKKWGCDWVRCSMCKTEICWVRRCARWGPKGRGDTTGGCQCGVNGVKCHPKCTYCH